MKNPMRTLGHALLAGGVLLSVCWAGLLAHSHWTQEKAERELRNQLRHTFASSLSDYQAQKASPVRHHRGEVIGRLDVPRLKMSVMVLEGSDPGILRVGAGHVQGTVFPGMVGNVGIAAHRDTFFRPLRAILPQDLITVTTAQGTFRYRVEGTEIVNASDVRVLHPTRDSELTLVTCYPFYYVGSAPKRFIVHASAAKISPGS